ncbi:hypothetical protein DYH09_33755 [bacterium CPR1]|nr:hypothetical protein [bacterium CPR1]
MELRPIDSGHPITPVSRLGSTRIEPIDPSRVAAMSSEQIRALEAYNNQVLGDVEKVRGLGGLGGLGSAGPATEQKDVVEIEVVQGASRVKARMRKLGVGSYDVEVGSDKFRMTLSASLDGQAEQFARELLQEYVKIPQHMRHVLKEVRINDGPNPADKEWEKRYGIPGFSSAAAAGNGGITFFNGAKHQGRSTIAHAFVHEFGHLVGQQVEENQDTWLEWLLPRRFDSQRYPDGWEKAMKADGKAVDGGQPVVGADGKERQYSESSPAEDFAEAFQEYVKAHLQGKEALAKFQATYPYRAKILADIFSGRQKV